MESAYLQTGKYGLLLLRLFLAARLIYGVYDNLLSWERMQEFANFLLQYNFPIPLGSAILSVIVQFVAAILVAIGYRTRWATLFLIFNFLVALFGVHLAKGDSVEALTPALAMLVISITLLLTGPGELSIDSRKKKGNYYRFRRY